MGVNDDYAFRKGSGNWPAVCSRKSCSNTKGGAYCAPAKVEGSARAQHDTIRKSRAENAAISRIETKVVRLGANQLFVAVGHIKGHCANIKVVVTDLPDRRHLSGRAG